MFLKLLHLSVGAMLDGVQYNCGRVDEAYRKAWCGHLIVNLCGHRQVDKPQGYLFFCRFSDQVVESAWAVPLTAVFFLCLLSLFLFNCICLRPVKVTPLFL